MHGLLSKRGRQTAGKGDNAGDRRAEGAVISYEAYPGETPELVGGQRVEGFQPAEEGMLSVHLPAVEAREWYFRQLFVNGRRQIRARYPNFDPDDPIRGGFLYVAHSRSGFGLTVGNIHNPDDWTEYRVQIPADGEYVLWIYYGALNAPHGTSDMSGRTTLTVDSGAPIPLADTPGWAATRWARAATVPLKHGERTLRWQNVRAGGLTLDAFILCDHPQWKPAGPMAPEAPERCTGAWEAPVPDCPEQTGMKIQGVDPWGKKG